MEFDQEEPFLMNDSYECCRSNAIEQDPLFRKLCVAYPEKISIETEESESHSVGEQEFFIALNDSQVEYPTKHTLSTYETLLHLLELQKQRYEWQSMNIVKQQEHSHLDYPYYRRNFNTIMIYVLKRHPHLLIEEEFVVLNRLLYFPDDMQKLYMRLIQRNTEWMSLEKVAYDEIKDITTSIETLKKEGFIHTGLEQGHQFYDLLTKEDIKAIFGKAVPNTLRSDNKVAFIEETLQKSSKQLTLDGTYLSNRIQQKLSDKLSRYFKVNPYYLRLMKRLLRLFFMNYKAEELGFSELYLISIEERRYPAYRIWQTECPFKTRVAYINFEESLELELRLQKMIVEGQWKDAANIITELELFKEKLSNVDFVKPISSFLLRYTSSWVITRLKSAAVGIFEKLHLYTDAIRYLHDLLSQDTFCLDKRGRWYDRLSINLASHVKDLPSAIEVCYKGISDTYVRTARRYALERRLNRLLKLTKMSPSFRTDTKMRSCPTKTLVAKRLKPSSTNSRVLYDSLHEKGPVNVEVLALHHYMETEAWTAGFHSEGGILQMIYILLFWDIVFTELPNVFQTPYQDAPLDMMEDCFYVSRKKLIEDRLEYIASDKQNALTLLSNHYTQHQGISAISVQWDTFSLETLTDVVSCVPSFILSGICRLFAQDFRHHIGGLPDLLLYNLASYSIKLVEVKSEHDRLSDRQRVWIHELVSLGLEVEVLHILDAS
jgi:Fanconi-associated nuclease 1